MPRSRRGRRPGPSPTPAGPRAGRRRCRGAFKPSRNAVTSPFGSNTARPDRPRSEVRDDGRGSGRTETSLASRKTSLPPASRVRVSWPSRRAGASGIAQSSSNLTLVPGAIERTVSREVTTLPSRARVRVKVSGSENLVSLNTPKGRRTGRPAAKVLSYWRANAARQGFEAYWPGASSPSQRCQPA